ncbi:exported hypothetical protein [uncultured Mycobacterium sp.]|uniref:Uncharacterized protein n=1 Tax=uncultured Mycobacterium sp. TaxID=171292 RepID=A0A1Y5PJM9_9MYCO|nr:exported hypothetical protein [uncultured Mycobacterium sp.]
MFKVFFVSAALAAVIASSLASQASVARMISVMGHNGKGRFGRFLSYIRPGFLTPTHAVVNLTIVVFFAFGMALTGALRINPMRIEEETLAEGGTPVMHIEHGQ